MTKKEKAVIGTWLNDMTLFEQQQHELWKELGELYVTRGGGERPTCSLLAHYDYLQTSSDRQTRDRAKIIWTKYYEAQAQIDARMKLGQALANL